MKQLTGLQFTTDQFRVKTRYTLCHVVAVVFCDNVKPGLP